jgi:hypothetical protein
MVMGVLLEVIRELIDTGAQQSNLNFRRSGIPCGALKITDDFLLGFCIQRHVISQIKHF